MLSHLDCEIEARRRQIILLDHVPIPSDPTYLPVVVPWLSSIPYDQLDFTAHPGSQVWDCAFLAAGDFSQEHALEGEAFIQGWLYFAVYGRHLVKLPSKLSMSNLILSAVMGA
jgi:hypothetical protein